MLQPPVQQPLHPQPRIPLQNNFDLIRFGLAFIVFLVHSHVLSQTPELSFLSSHLSSDMAVKAFFVVSGILVTMSFETSASVRDYFIKRVRRIYPAYATVVILTVLLGLVITSASLREYASLKTLSYLLANMAFLNFLSPTLPRVFAGNTVNAANGALWTLKIEVMFYVMLPAIVWLGRRVGKATTLLGIYVLSAVYSLGMEQLAARTGNPLYLELQRQLPGQLTYFTSGMGLFYCLERIRKYWALLLSLTLPVFWFAQVSEVRILLEPIAVAILVVYLAVGLRYLGNFGRFGDLSYGIYILHFPLLQTLIASGRLSGKPFWFLLTATLLLLALALLSWHLIEKPALSGSSHYVQSAR